MCTFLYTFKLIDKLNLMNYRIKYLLDFLEIGYLNAFWYPQPPGKKFEKKFNNRYLV